MLWPFKRVKAVDTPVRRVNDKTIIQFQVDERGEITFRLSVRDVMPNESGSIRALQLASLINKIVTGEITGQLLKTLCINSGLSYDEQKLVVDAVEGAGNSDIADPRFVFPNQ